MSTVELKKKLIHTIQKIEDEDILAEVYRLLELDIDSYNIYKLNDEQKEAIAESREQIQNGQFLTEEEADKEIDKWLEK